MLTRRLYQSSRWLYTDHGAPLNEEQVKEATTPEIRAWAKEEVVGLEEVVAKVLPLLLLKDRHGKEMSRRKKELLNLQE